MLTLQMSQFACLISNILSIHPVLPTYYLNGKFSHSLFLCFLFTNQAQGQELMQGINNT